MNDDGRAPGSKSLAMHRGVVSRTAALLASALLLGPMFGAAFAMPGVPIAVAAGPAAIELEIESTINLTRINASPVVDGVARVAGRIRLEPGTGAGTWSGRGELASTTSSGRGGCGSIHVEGEGVYDWVVNEVVVSPGIAAERIVAHMDAGQVVEAPDVFELDACGSTLDGTLNTWENVFFFRHNADFGAKGFEVGGWELHATGPTWSDGELIATATWAGSCGDGPLVGCEEETAFRLYAVGSAGGPSAAPESPASTPAAAGSGGGLAVRTLDPAGTALTNACLELWTDAGGTRGTLLADSRRCDAPRDPTGLVGPEDGWVDGSLGWSGLAPGRYLVVETQAPADSRGGYETAADTAVEIRAGAVSPLGLTHFLRNALTLYKVDAAGDPVPGACFAIAGPRSGRTGPPPGSAVCDGEAPATGGPPGDDLADGILVLPSNELTGTPGTYTVIESRPPAGYAPLALQTVELAPDRATVLTVTNDTGAIAAPAGTPVPSPAAEPLVPIAGLACSDLTDCIATYWPFVLGALAAAGIVAVVGLNLLRRPPIQLPSGPAPTDVPGSSLDYDKLTYDKLTYDKIEGLDLEASETDIDKLPIGEDAPGSGLDYDKLDYDKLEDPSANEGTSEPDPGIWK